MLKGFSEKWCDWVLKVVSGGRVMIKVNNNVGPYFKTHKGLRQGDPLSPLFFDIAADASAILIEKAKKSRLD